MSWVHVLLQCLHFEHPLEAYPGLLNVDIYFFFKGIQYCLYSLYIHEWKKWQNHLYKTNYKAHRCLLHNNMGPALYKINTFLYRTHPSLGKGKVTLLSNPLVENLLSNGSSSDVIEEGRLDLCTIRHASHHKVLPTVLVSS